MTLDFLEATDVYDLSVSDSEEHGKVIFHFLNALAHVRIIRDAWVSQRYKRILGSPDNDKTYMGLTLRIDAREHGDKC